MQGLLSLTAGAVFAGDYRIVEPLSAGGMGAVYLVHQLSTGKQRALKLMHPLLVADPELRRKFEQEARVGSRIESEHVVEVHAAGVDSASGMPWLVMELLRGEDLAAYVAKRGPRPPSEVCAIFEQLCHAIGAAHAAGIVHRDLKPENVFVGESKRAGAKELVKVLDFGIAKLSAEAGTKSTAAMGSPAWMAPEQTTRATITAAADVWSLGLLAYFLLVGRPFWRAAAEDAPLAELLRELVLDPIPTARERAAESGLAELVPPAFDAWFARCVQRDVRARIRDANQAWRELAIALRGDDPAMAPTDPLAPPLTLPTPPPPKPPPPAPSTPARPIEGGTAPNLASRITPPPEASARMSARAIAIVIGLTILGVGAIYGGFQLGPGRASRKIYSTDVAPIIVAKEQIEQGREDEGCRDLESALEKRDPPRVRREVPEVDGLARRCLPWLDVVVKRNHARIDSPLLTFVDEDARRTFVESHAPPPPTETPPLPSASVSASASARPVRAPSLRAGPVSAKGGRLPQEVIQTIVRQQFGKFRLCYESGLRANPSLHGKVVVSFVIDAAGNVATASDAGSDLPDRAVVACVIRHFDALKFPVPEGGSVSVISPLVFAPPAD